MFAWIRTLLWPAAGRQPSSPRQDLGPCDANPVVAACITGRQENGPKATAGCWEHAESKPEYERFCATFCLQPGVRLVDVIDRDGLSQLRSWLHFDSEDAEPKAFIRLMLALADHGESVWDQPGISLFLEGRCSLGGGPSRASDEALAILARTLGKPIKLFFVKQPGDPYWVNTYET